MAVTSEVTTVQLEFKELSCLTKDSIYNNKTLAAANWVHNLPKLDGVVPINMNVKSGE